jgi:FkbM family methyltransferase
LILIELINSIFFLFKKKNFKFSLYDELSNNFYSKLSINQKDIIFYTPSLVSKRRIETLFTKETDTIKWIKNFNGKDKIFWDIGANIGIFSIYASTIFEDIKVIAFEPSFLNLRILSRNISKNNFSNKIKIIQFPLTDKPNQILDFNEFSLEEGASQNSFGVNYGHDGKVMKYQNSFSIYGTNIDYLIENNISEIPNYIKLDVDGIEHLILKGGEKTILKSKILKSIILEINEDFDYQKKSVLKLLEKNNFKFYQKNKIGVKSNCYNYIFEKNL